MRISILYMVLISTFLLFSDLPAEVYQWTDENGVKHFTDEPPENVKEPVEVSTEKPYDEEADKQRTQADKEEMKTLVKEVDAEDEKDKKEAAAKAEETAKNQPESDSDKIARERERLENKIEELEQMPLDYFGSQKNKRTRVGYYRYRLEELDQDPKKYFNSPEKFEGNDKQVEKK